jgi:LysM repeat protein
MANTQVKNPNYNPLDPNSKRYVSVPNAVQEADNRAQSMNELMQPFGDLFKPFSGLNFFTPPNVPSTQANPTAPVVTPKAPNANAPFIGPVAPAAPVASAQAGKDVADLKQAGANTAPAGANVPTPTSAQTYTIQAGDSLSKIAQRYGTTVNALAAANGIADPNIIQAGATLKIPTGAGGAAPTGTAGTINVPATGDANTDAALKQLASKAGEAGLSIGDYLSVVEGQGLPTAEESTEIRNKLGIPDLIDETFGKPDKKTIEQYRELYSLAGLNDIKSQIKDINATINQKRDDLIKATGEVNNNPWISQSTRAGRLKNLQELAFADINNDIEQKNQLLDLYDNGIDEIERQIGFIAADTETDRTINTEKLNFLLTEAEREETLVQRETLTKGLRNIPDFLQGLLDREATEAARARQLKATSSTSSGGSTSIPLGTPASQELQNAFNRSVLGLSKDARGFAVGTFNDLIEQGRVDEAKSLIIQTAIEGADTETARKLIGREEALAAVDDIRASLVEYEAAGGSTNKLRGGYEKLIQKLGTTSDPTLARIENDIRLSIQAYRQAVSGAAFTESESKEYQSVFPDIDRSHRLNTAKLDSLENLFSRNQSIFFKQRLGSENYEALYGAGAAASTPAVTPSAETTSYINSLNLPK